MKAVQSHIVVGLSFGDEGKGSWVDHLVRKHGARYVVRFNGGAQAAHHVLAPDGRTHRFRQFGSGTLVPGTYTILSRFMLVDPQYAFEEAAELAGKGVDQPLYRLIVSAHAPVITPFNRLLNRIQEVARGGSRHGSCGFGVGLTQNDVETLGANALYISDLSSNRLEEKLRYLWRLRIEDAKKFETEENADLRALLQNVDIPYYVELFQQFRRLIRVIDDDEFAELIYNNGTVFEGAQGVMLDQNWGTFPHCTRSNCTFENALTLLSEAEFNGAVTRVGLTRAYATRHGEGPFVTEDPALAVSPCDNGTNPWQGRFRTGWFDAVALRYALAVTNGVDVLAVTNLDRLVGLGPLKIANRYLNGNHLLTTEGEMSVPGCVDLELLRQRTASLFNVAPEYVHHPGCLTRDGMESYLAMLEGLIQHPIQAFSDTADHRKTYK